MHNKTSDYFISNVFLKGLVNALLKQQQFKNRNEILMKPEITVDLGDECKKDDKIAKCQDPRDFEQKHGPSKDTA